MPVAGHRSIAWEMIRASMCLMGRILQIAIGVAVTLGLCGALVVWLYPERPITTYQQTSQPERGYNPTGSDCELKNLAAMPFGIDREAKTKECAAEREDHRKQQADLEQQTRAANAAMSGAYLAYDATRVTLVAAILSVVTTALLVWTLWETRSASRAELRAYVLPVFSVLHISNVPARDRKRISNETGISVGAKNSGQTPATDVTHWIAVDIRSSDQEDTLIFPKRRNGGSVTVISPQDASIATGVIHNVTPEQEVALKAGTSHLYAWGVITYRDVFKRERLSRYRVKYMGAWPPPKDATITFCGQGNDHT